MQMEHFLTKAIEAARAAGELIRANLGRYATLETKASATDLVTNVDRECERRIAEVLLTAFPDHFLLGEEGTADQARRVERDADLTQVEYLWVCDPIDGTINFIHGIPGSTVSICLAVRGEPVLGVVYDPARDELFHAVKGHGAFVNGQPMRVRSETVLKESLVATGFSSRPSMREKNVHDLLTMTPLVRNVRNLGSAALHLAYVAAGRLTAYWENGLSPWDLAGGVVLVMEAGGMVTAINGAPYTLATANIMATNGGIHAELRAQVAQ
ncbi:MAG TPA: inositol monophosphatase family protein [Symbiobacteriaceae bacterium]|jgi:myo-inositol-1(or 4)-monophosphatase|nr:inositol monophosphatase family protein [Symbiobacteriaceae bacterium]